VAITIVEANDAAKTTIVENMEAMYLILHHNSDSGSAGQNKRKKNIVP